ncbi:MAG: HAD-IA family hydrolase [Thermoflavifilum aggregans]|nr:HAD-IA family hydrolase [Thermoflavifilum aggregans]
MPEIRLVVFDMIGTVINDHHAIEQSLISAFAEMDISVSEEQVSAVMGLHKKEAIQILCRKNGYTDDTDLAEKIYHQFMQRLWDAYAEKRILIPFPDAEKIFAWLHGKGIKVALNTGFDTELMMIVLKQIGWVEHPLIDGVVASDQVKRGRPFPDMIQYLMQKAGVSHSYQVMKVGDTEADIMEGRNAACGYVVGILTGSSSAEQLIRHKPDDIIHQLNEIKNRIH